MPQSIPSLETRRTELLRALGDLKDMRPGSVVGAVFSCRKPNCHCSRPDDRTALAGDYHGSTRRR